MLETRIRLSNGLKERATLATALECFVLVKLPKSTQG